MEIVPLSSIISIGLIVILVSCPQLTEGQSAVRVAGTLAGSGFGAEVGFCGDLNGDGLPDVMVAAPDYSNGQNNEGAVFIYYGLAGGLDTLNPAILEINQAEAHFGREVQYAGDINGDGFTDILVAAPNYDNGQTEEGAVFVFTGSSTGINTLPALTIESLQDSAFLGQSLAAGLDLNQDGYADFAFSSIEYDAGLGRRQGRVWLYLGGPSVSALLPNLINGPDTSSEFGYSVSLITDTDGDGFGELGIGAPGYSSGQAEEGAIYWYGLGPSGLSGVSRVLEIDNANGRFGSSLAGLGDVNGDGFGDLGVVAEYYSTSQTGAGAILLYYGSAGGLNTSHSFRASGTNQNDYLGARVRAIGDMDRDGLSDFAVARNPIVTASLIYPGKSEVYLGQTDSTQYREFFDLAGNYFFAYQGERLTSAGDIDQDGFGDLILSERGFSNATGAVGAFQIVFGEGELLSSIPQQILEVNQANAYLGNAVSSADVNGDGISDVLAGARFYTQNFNAEGAALLFMGGFGGVDTTAAWSYTGGQDSAQLGFSVSGAGDVNGDGYEDIIVGSPGYGNGQINEGRALVFYGSANGLSGNPDWTFEPNAAGEALGQSVSGAGDINGDGFDDVLVGAYGSNHLGGSFDGACYVFLGSVSGLSPEPIYTLLGQQLNGRFGFAVSGAGDVNGDGYSDVLVGAYEQSNGGLPVGAVHCFHGNPEGLADTAAWIAYGENSGDDFGYSVRGVGDVNADGYSDVVVGAVDYDLLFPQGGAAYVYLGGPAGLSNTYNWRGTGSETNAFYGFKVAGGGDLNQDGFADVVIGAYGQDGDFLNEGMVTVVPGSAAGADTAAVMEIISESPGGRSGSGISNLGDVNGDGITDLLVGVERHEDPEFDEGAIYIHNGKANTGRPNILQSKNAAAGQLYTPIPCLCDQGFSASLRFVPPAGVNSASLEVAVTHEGQSFQQATVFSGPFQAISGGLDSLSLYIPYQAQDLTRYRARLKYPAGAIPGGGTHGPWIYPSEYHSPLRAGGRYGSQVIVWDGANYCKGSGNNNAPAQDDDKRLLIHGDSARIAEYAEVLIFQQNWPHKTYVSPEITLTVLDSAKNFNYNPATVVLEANAAGYHGSYIGPPLENVQAQIGYSYAGWHNMTVPLEGYALQQLNAHNPAPPPINLSLDSNRQNVWRYNNRISNIEQVGIEVGAYKSHAWGVWQMPNTAQSHTKNRAFHIYFGPGYGSTPRILSANGNIYEESFTDTLYPHWGGWNMLANPYTSALDLNQFYQLNAGLVDPGIFIWHAPTARYVAIDASTGLAIHPDLTSSSNSTNAAMGQSFYVRPTNYVNDSSTTFGLVGSLPTSIVQKTPALRGDWNTRFIKVQPRLLRIKINAINSQSFDQCIITESIGYNDGYQRGEDIEKFIDFNDSVPNLFVADSGNIATAISKNSTPLFKNRDRIPLGILWQRSGLIEFSVLTNSLPYKFELIDAKYNANYRLEERPISFYFNHLNDIHRSFLSWRDPELLSAEKNQYKTPYYVKESRLFVRPLGADDRATLVDIYDRVTVYENSWKIDGQWHYSESLKRGTYILIIQNIGQLIDSFKIII